MPLELVNETAEPFPEATFRLGVWPGMARKRPSTSTPMWSWLFVLWLCLNLAGFGKPELPGFYISSTGYWEKKKEKITIWEYCQPRMSRKKEREGKWGRMWAVCSWTSTFTLNWKKDNENFKKKTRTLLRDSRLRAGNT